MPSDSASSPSTASTAARAVDQKELQIQLDQHLEALRKTPIDFFELQHCINILEKLNRKNEAVQLCDSFLIYNISQVHRASVLGRRALLLFYDLNEKQRALLDAREAYKLNPVAHTAVPLVRILISLEKFDEAKRIIDTELAKKITTQDINRAHLFIERADIFIRERNPAAAKSDALNALTQCSYREHPLTYINSLTRLANAQEGLGELADALKSYDSAMRISRENDNVNSKVISYYRENLLKRMEPAAVTPAASAASAAATTLFVSSRDSGRVRREKRLAGIEAELNTSPENVNLYISKAILLRDLKRYDVALAITELALKLKHCANDSTECRVLHSVRGDIFHKMRDYQKALDSYDEAVKRCSNRNDEYAFLLASRGLQLYCLGRNQEAIESYNQALVLLPEDQGILGNRQLAVDALARQAKATNAAPPQPK